MPVVSCSTQMLSRLREEARRLSSNVLTRVEPHLPSIFQQPALLCSATLVRRAPSIQPDVQDTERPVGREWSGLRRPGLGVTRRDVDVVCLSDERSFVPGPMFASFVQTEKRLTTGRPHRVAWRSETLMKGVTSVQLVNGVRKREPGGLKKMGLASKALGAHGRRCPVTRKSCVSRKAVCTIGFRQASCSFTKVDKVGVRRRVAEDGWRRQTRRLSATADHDHPGCLQDNSLMNKLLILRTRTDSPGHCLDIIHPHVR